MNRVDLSILGSSIKYLPPLQWQERMFFSGVPDRDLRERTGSFPATIRKHKTTHPIFVLRTQLTGHLVCPCSTKDFSGGHQRYIRQGCRLEMSEETTKTRSYLVEKYVFTVPLDGRFSGKLQFRGRVPESCLSRPDGTG